MKTSILAALVVAVCWIPLHIVADEADAPGTADNSFDANICSNSSNLFHNRPISSTQTPDNGFWITGINDGATSTSGSNSSNTFFGADGLGSHLTNNPQVTIQLDTVASPLGYDLTSITSIYGWGGYDQSFANQKYTVSYSTVSAPTTFITLTSVDYHYFQNPANDPTNYNSPASSQVTLTNLGAVSGVAYVRFTFSVSSNGGTDPQGGQVIREIQAFGSPTRSIVPVTTSSSSETTYDAGIAALASGGTDVLAGRSVSCAVTPDNSFPIAGLTDGLASEGGSETNDTFFAADNFGSTLLSNPVVTIALDIIDHPAGYDLSSIITTNGWQNYDRSLSDQKYAVAYSTVAAPTTFIPLTTVDYHPFSNDSNDPADRDNPVSSQVTLPALSGLTGVAALQFTFQQSNNDAGTDPQGGQVIRELAAVGTPSIPEGTTPDIAPMTWNSTGRSDWINVVAYGADITGQRDSTSAIQAALDVNNNNQFGSHKTIFFPAGTYKISSTLKITNISTYNLIGCGLGTIIKWCGASGSAMITTDSVYSARYLGLVWDGNNLAGCAYEDYSVSGGYGSNIRHENEAFRNFNVQGTYISGRVYPAAAVISGFDGGGTTGECTFFNCSFYNCSVGIYSAVDQVQYYMWFIDGCEFENNEVGFDGGQGGCYIVTNSHFKQDSFADIVGGRNIWCQRLTSSGSGQLYIDKVGGSHTVLEDCDVDGWTNPSAAVSLSSGGQDTMMDCTFTTPPSGATNPVLLNGPIDLLSSNNSAPSSAAVMNLTGTNDVINVPAGARGKNITSATTTFLKSTALADGAAILDVTQAPYTADNSGSTDSTATIQAAITAAKAANNGTIVYLPPGFYTVSSTLDVCGGNYTIEGCGVGAHILWEGSSTGTVFNVVTPQAIELEQMQISLPGTASAAVTETSTGASTAIYDNILVNLLNPDNYAQGGDLSDGQGIVLNDLPASSSVYMPVLSSPLTVIDSGPAQILARMAYFGNINVSGATNAKTGFCGMVVAEGAQHDVGSYNIVVNDNQNLVLGAYYSEQCRNDLSLLRGAGTTTGDVAILGMNSASGTNEDPYDLNTSTDTINVNNYAGRLFYGESGISNDKGAYPVQVVQTGTNPIDLMLVDDFFDPSAPTVTTGTSANLIQILNEYGLLGSTSNLMSDSPSTLSSANLTSLSNSLDDLRQLGAVDLSVEAP